MFYIKKQVLFIWLILSGISLFSQNTFELVSDSENRQFIVGEIQRADLETDLCANWFFAEYETYSPDEQTLELLKEVTPPSGIIFLATWCSDSQRELPRFYKIVDLLKWCPDNFELYCLDRSKTLPGKDIGMYQIEYVPTFIFISLATDTEIGRIIESPIQSLEADLLKILSQ